MSQRGVFKVVGTGILTPRQGHITLHDVAEWGDYLAARIGGCHSPEKVLTAKMMV